MLPIINAGIREHLTFWTINKVWRLKVQSKDRLRGRGRRRGGRREKPTLGGDRIRKTAMLPKNEMFTESGQSKQGAWAWQCRCDDAVGKITMNESDPDPSQS